MNLLKITNDNQLHFDTKRTSYSRFDEDNASRKRPKLNSYENIINSIDKDKEIQLIENSIKDNSLKDVRATVSLLEFLPNELLFSILSHLSIIHIVEAFYGHNQRFNAIVFHYTRYFYIPNNLSRTWLDKYMPSIADSISKIYLESHLLTSVFPYEHAYKNLTSMVIKNSNSFTVEFNVEASSAFTAAVTYLNIFFQSSTSKLYPPKLFFKKDNVEQKLDNQIHTCFDGDPCFLAVTRLEICNCTEIYLLSICSLMRNMTSLCVRTLEPTSAVSFKDDLFRNTSQCGSLTHLKLSISHTDDIHLETIELLIRWNQSCLKKVTLIITSSTLLIKGHHLQKMFESCRNLNKLEFVFTYYDKDVRIDMIDLYRQFQSDWWLDSGRAPVLIIRNSHNHIFIGTMPCCFPINVTFPTNMNQWWLNKGSLDSSSLRFTKQKSICFQSDDSVEITPDFVHFIGGVFPSDNLTITLDNWKFRSTHTLFAEWINNRTAIPVLKTLKKLDMNSSNCRGLDAKTLILCLWLAPNVKILDLKSMKTRNKTILISELDRLLRENDSLKSILDGIKMVEILPYGYRRQTRSTRKLAETLSNIFSKAIILNLN